MKRDNKKPKPTSFNGYPNKVKSGRSARRTLTLNHIKLAVAMELRADGYGTIVFNRVLGTYDRRIRVHVYCEDELAQRLAVYSVNKPCQVKPNDVLDVISAIGKGIRDCDVAIAFPTSLLPKAEALIGMTNNVFMVDDSGRVWVRRCGCARVT